MREISDTSNLTVGQPFTIYGIMQKVTVKRSFHGHIPMTLAKIVDNTGDIRCVWFNQAYIGKMYPDGTKVKVSGIIHEDKNGVFLSNPNIERAGSVIPKTQESLFAPNTDTNFLTPIYSETKGVTSLYLYTLIKMKITLDSPIS